MIMQYKLNIKSVHHNSNPHGRCHQLFCSLFWPALQVKEEENE